MTRPWPPARFTVLTLCLASSCAVLACSGPTGAHALAFALAYIGAFASMLLCWRALPLQEGGQARMLLFLLALGLILRLLFLFLYPASNDVYRYVVEGHVQLLGINPYRIPPQDLSALPGMEAVVTILPLVNHPDLTSPYPPLAMLLFRATAWISPTVPAFKLLMCAADCAALGLLALWMHRRRIPARNLVLYAANPLVLVFLSGEAHVDALQVLGVAAALLLFARKQPGGGFLALGAAVMLKYLSVILLPFFIRRQGLHKALLALLPMAAFLCYADAGTGVFSSLSGFGLHMHYNDSITALLRLVGMPPPLAVQAGAALLILLCAAIFLTVHSAERSAFVAASCLLLCLPTLHPWYLCLATPFLIRYPSRAMLLLHVCILATLPVLAAEQSTGVFQEIPTWKLLEYGPFFLLLAWDRLNGRTAVSPLPYGPVTRLAVVVPCLNEEQGIGNCLESLPRDVEVIVADGGSTDRTREIARDLGATVVRSEPGRGVQIREGIAASTADAVLVLHADCRLQQGMVREILSRLNQDPLAAGGAVGMRFDALGFGPRCIAFLNDLRVRFTGISFGDQGQYFRMQALERAGGFPPLLLMEDVELSLRLKETGQMLLPGTGVLVSYRTWDRRSARGSAPAGRSLSRLWGMARGVLLILGLFLGYLLQRRLGRIGSAARYHRLYYGRSG